MKWASTLDAVWGTSGTGSIPAGPGPAPSMDRSMCLLLQNTSFTQWDCGYHGGQRTGRNTHSAFMPWPVHTLISLVPSLGQIPTPGQILSPTANPERT